MRLFTTAIQLAKANMTWSMKAERCDAEEYIEGSGSKLQSCWLVLWKIGAIIEVPNRMRNIYMIWYPYRIGISAKMICWMCMAVRKLSASN